MKGLAKQIIRFGMVGLLCFGVDYGLLIFMTELCKFHYLLAGGISFSVSVAVNYLLSMKFVFQPREGRDKRTDLVMFLFMSFIGLGLNEFVMAISVEQFQVHYLFSKFFAAALVMIYNFISRKLWLERRPNKRILTVCSLAVLVMFLEVFLFNYRTFASLFFPEEAAFEISTGDGITKDEYGNYVIPEEENTGFIKVEQINTEVKNIGLGMHYVPQPVDGLEKITVEIYASDEGHKGWYPMNPVVLTQGKTEYIPLNFYGTCRGLLFRFPGSSGQTVAVDSLVCNTRRPLQISWARVLWSSAMIGLAYVLRPKSFLYQILFQLERKTIKGVVCLLVILQMVTVCSVIVTYQDAAVYNHTSAEQYPLLAKALTRGKFYLEEEPPEELKELEDPYDISQRNEAGVPYRWDTAYYQGKYYVYFGIVPVLLLYLPFYVLTGQFLSEIAALCIGACILVLGYTMLLLQITRTYKKVSLGKYLLAQLMVFLCSGVFLLTKRPTFYGIPICLGIGSSCLGIACWMRSTMEQEVRKDFLFAGSCFMALVAGCRPPMLLGSILAFPLLLPLWKEWDKRERMENLMVFAIPYTVVAAFLCSYNYQRFGSILDFGAAYNLTVSNVPLRGFKMDRIPEGIFRFLLQPFHLSVDFPFLRPTDGSAVYRGMRVDETMYGGAFWLYPIFMMLLPLGKFRKRLQEHGLWSLCITSLVLVPIMAILEAEAGSVVLRYMLDILFFLSIPLLAVFLAEGEERTGSPPKRYQYLLCTATGLLTICSVYALT